MELYGADISPLQGSLMIAALRRAKSRRCVRLNPLPRKPTVVPKDELPMHEYDVICIYIFALRVIYWVSNGVAIINIIPIVM